MFFSVFGLLFSSEVFCFVPGPSQPRLLRSFLHRRGRDGAVEPILGNLEKSADAFKGGVTVKVVESSEKLNDRTCADFKEQGKFRLKELNEATKFIEDASEALQTRIKELAELKKKSDSSQKAAEEVENSIKTNSVKTNANEHVTALFKAMDVAQGIDSQTWRDASEALEALEADNVAALKTQLEEAKKARTDAVGKITDIFNSPKNTEFCVSGVSSETPSAADSSATPSSSPKTSKSLHAATQSAVSMLHQTGHMIQVQDELKLETTLLELLTQLEASLDKMAKSIAEDAFKGLQEALDKILRSDVKNEANSEEFNKRKSALLAAETALKEAQSSLPSLTDTKVAKEKAKQLIALNLAAKLPSLEKLFQ